MKRKRNGLVPIASALADLPGPVQAIREASPDTAVSSCGQYAAGAEASPLPRPGATHGGKARRNTTGVERVQRREPRIQRREVILSGLEGRASDSASPPSTSL